jgi:hypothetical protein
MTAAINKPKPLRKAKVKPYQLATSSSKSRNRETVSKNKLRDNDSFLSAVDNVKMWQSQFPRKSQASLGLLKSSLKVQNALSEL